MSRRTLAIFSLKGGVGRTTVTANLAAELVHAGVKVMVVDADPQNCTGLHFGMEVGERFGFVRADATMRQVEDYNALLRTSARVYVPHLPFGFCSLQEVMEIEEIGIDEPNWFRDRLDALIPPWVELVLIDSPPGLSSWAKQILTAADEIVVVLQPDAASYVTLPMLRELMSASARGPVSYLVNNYDSRWQLARDVYASLEHALGSDLLPWVVPMDPALPEAHARRRLLLETAPDSQPVAVFRQIAGYLVPTLATTPPPKQ